MVLRIGVEAVARAHHVAECTVEGDLDDPWYPRQLGRTEEEEEEEEEGGQDERERNKSPERNASWHRRA
ncbi:hypothetical protein APICC_05867 [Apis cerana cerana]|uniref:Uncharacterized protein n=1 Tax=Apis cerana cerana TaxID=94128 RepID=A0A2A3ETR8_APICC|nr:hypothetical protein APICC_05867 [Apis cerana cerana]